jgi:putative RecB family exonuclease
MPTYSNSRLSCFEQCPLKFKFAYIDKIEAEIPTTVEAFMGDMVHQALEKLYKDLQFEKILTQKELIAFYNDLWEKNWNEDILIVRKEYDKDNYRKIGERALVDYYKHYKPFDESITIALETKKMMDISDKYHIHVRIDRLAFKDGVYEIHDYKTSSRLPTQQELDEDRQLALYAYGIKKMYPDAKKVELVWHFLKFDKEMRSSRTAEQLEALRGEVLKLIKKIEECKDYPAKVSALCDWCEFQNICPQWKHKFATEELSPNEYLKEDGVKLVNEYVKYSEQRDKAEEELEKIREALLAYCKKEGVDVVFGSDVKATIKSYPKVSFPKKGDLNREEFVEVLKKIGLFEHLAAPDVYELAKMINNGEIHEDLRKLLDKFIKRDETVRVYLGRK